MTNAFSPANMIGGTIFGSVGFVAFVYGKKQASFKLMIIGAALMAYPFFISDTRAVYGVGALLTACLFLFRD